MDQDKKRELRQLKREIKRKGGKIRRRQLKQSLADNPEDAQDAVVSFGKFESKTLNGLDRSQTWQEQRHAGAAEPEPGPEPEPPAAPEPPAEPGRPDEAP